jgi:glucan 1,3-beta-glucosidase
MLLRQIVRVSGSAVLTKSVQPGQSWIRGTAYLANSTVSSRTTGDLINAPRPSVLVNSTGSFYTVVPPTYQDVDISQVVHVKNVSGHPVTGDGTTDDTTSLQAIITAAAAANQLAYFPFGVYILTNTLLIPTGSRLVGEAFTQLAAKGSNFANANSPRPMVKIGNPGDTGIFHMTHIPLPRRVSDSGTVGLAQMTDFVFTLTTPLPGTILIEVNMAGDKPGNVGFFNCHFSIGWLITSNFGSCTAPASCQAAHVCAHFTSSSSVYWENSWASSNASPQSGPSDGGGFLVESQKGTWTNGIGSGKCN